MSDGHRPTYAEPYWRKLCEDCGRPIRYGMYCSDSDGACWSSRSADENTTDNQGESDENE